MTGSPSRDHAWVRGRALAYRSGLLDPADAGSFEAHLESCEECRTLLEQLDETHAEGFATGAHIAAGMKTRWNVARAELRGFERAMVARHLARCADCRADLERLGFEARLDEAMLTDPETGEVLDLSFAGKPASQEGASAVTGAVRPLVEAGRRTVQRGFDWIRVALGGWALAASAAAVLLVMRPALPPEPALPGGPGDGPAVSIPEPGGTPGVNGSGSPAPVNPAPSGPLPGSAGPSLALAQIGELESEVRGEEDEVEPVRVSPVTAAVTLPIPIERLPDLPPATRIAIEVIGPDGLVMVRGTFRLSDLAAHRGFSLQSGGKPFASGRYRLRLQPEGGVPVESRFRIEAR
jgi:anti-sigma factor RsiW